MNKYLLAFINISVLIVVLIWVAPVAASLRNGKESVRLQQSRYHAENILAAEYEDNLRELNLLKTERGLLAKNEMLPALAEISVLGAEFGLINLEFTASEMVETLTDEAIRFYEMRVRTEYEGDFNDLISFLQEFMGGHGNTRSFYFSDLTSETSRLRLEFSLFGVDTE